MEKILKYFIEEKKLTKVVANVLAKTLTKYEDVGREFIYWLENRKYNEENPLEIEGYSATKIQELAPHMDAAGVYNFMVTLRDNPEKGHAYIKDGFPRK